MRSSDGEWLSPLLNASQGHACLQSQAQAQAEAPASRPAQQQAQQAYMLLCEECRLLHVPPRCASAGLEGVPHTSQSAASTSGAGGAHIQPWGSLPTCPLQWSPIAEEPQEAGQAPAQPIFMPPLY